MSTLFSAVMADLQRRLGKDPSVTMSDPLPAQYAQALSDALRVGWEAAFWPRAMLVEERTPDQDADGFRVIPWAQDGETEIGAVDVERCLYARDPRVWTGERPISGVELDPGGVLVPMSAPAGPLWLRFRPPARVYTKDDGNVSFPEWLRRFSVLMAASELLADDQARFRTRASAEEELERLLTVEFELAGHDSRARR